MENAKVLWSIFQAPLCLIHKDFASLTKTCSPLDLYKDLVDRYEHSTVSFQISNYKEGPVLSPTLNPELDKFRQSFQSMGGSGGPVVKNPPTNAGVMGSIPGLGRCHMQWAN